MGPLEGDFAIMAGKSAFIINMLALHGLQAKVLYLFLNKTNLDRGLDNFVDSFRYFNRNGIHFIHLITI